MNKLLVTLLFAVLISGCNKSGNVANEDPIPTAEFRINNTVADDVVLDGTTIDIVNNSQNGHSFEWDFGDGRIITDRTPTGVVLRNCPRTVQVRLVVRTRNGRTATIIRTITIRCR